MREGRIVSELLGWYDAHARDLPWRVPPAARARGVRPDPYHVWLSEVMLQQTTVAAVRGYFGRFLKRWPDVLALAAADEAEVMAEWAGLGYYARARNLHRCARVIAEAHGGRFPESRAELQKLPGIGPYTAAAIAAIAFDRPETVVDGNVERVISRLFAIRAPLPASKGQIHECAAGLTPKARPGDYAQALMDLGALICIPRKPRCAACPLKRACRGRAEGVAEALPARARRQPRPTRRGIAFVARRSDGAWLLERRPEGGLLGGMLGWPTGGWDATASPEPPLKAKWQDPGISVRHVFTHFSLVLELRIAEVGAAARPKRGAFIPSDGFRPRDLPSLMRKVHRAALAHLGEGGAD